MASSTKKKNTIIIKLAQQETYLQPDPCLLILFCTDNHGPGQIPCLISTTCTWSAHSLIHSQNSVKRLLYPFKAWVHLLVNISRQEPKVRFQNHLCSLWFWSTKLLCKGPWWLSPVVGTWASSHLLRWKLVSLTRTSGTWFIDFKLAY